MTRANVIVDFSNVVTGERSRSLARINATCICGSRCFELSSLDGPSIQTLRNALKFAKSIYQEIHVFDISDFRMIEDFKPIIINKDHLDISEDRYHNEFAVDLRDASKTDVLREVMTDSEDYKFEVQNSIFIFGKNFHSSMISDSLFDQVMLEKRSIYCEDGFGESELAIFMKKFYIKMKKAPRAKKKDIIITPRIYGT